MMFCDCLAPKVPLETIHKVLLSMTLKEHEANTEPWEPSSKKLEILGEVTSSRLSV